MRTFLITAAALGLMAGSAVAQDEMMAEGPSLSITGKGQLGIIYNGETENAAGTTLTEPSFTWQAEMDITIAGEGVTDGGLTFGAKTNINAEAAAGAKEIETPDVYIGGESWTITVGSPDPASELAFSLGDVGYDGLGVDDIAEGFANQFPGPNAAMPKAYGVKDAAQARLDLTFGVATVGVSVGQTSGTAYVPKKDASATHKVTTEIEGLPNGGELHVASAGSTLSADQRQANADISALKAFFSKTHSLTFTSLKTANDILVDAKNPAAPSGYYLVFGTGIERNKGLILKDEENLFGRSEDLTNGQAVTYRFDTIYVLPEGSTATVDGTADTDVAGREVVAVGTTLYYTDGTAVDRSNVVFAAANNDVAATFTVGNGTAATAKIVTETVNPSGEYKVWRVRNRNDAALRKAIADAMAAREATEKAFGELTTAQQTAQQTAHTAALTQHDITIQRARDALACEHGADVVASASNGQTACSKVEDGRDVDVGAVVTATAPDLTAYTAAMAEKMATKSKTNWALGTSFDLGVAKLGFGMDSEKKLQTSVSGEFGQFGGSIFYAMQDVDMPDGSEKKLTGLGGEFTATVQEGTTVNVVATRASMEGANDVDAFGAGVSHGLGGGATLQAGFARVKDQNKASVGVAMTF